MREILCRGKSLDNGKWESGYLLENQGRTFICQATNDNGRIAVAAVEVDPYTVGQYTGMKDKNGKKVCEADILTDKFESMGVVECRNNGFVVNFEGTGVSYLSNCLSDLYQMWVVGNIHDNADLIK